MRIFLIGFMGCGKSTIGKQLAESLDYNFTDLDSYIEQKTSKSIKEIFSENDEVYFRELEKDFLQEVIQKENIIISTGGGTPCFHNNMELILQNGVSIYLEMNVGNLAKRLCDEKQNRPLINNISCNKLEGFINSKLDERKRFYAQANYTINPEEISVDEIVKLLA